ncbi:RagB/SusD family nutrient uptake outer membrane protein [Tenacibaculum ovolyticum]|uniref:RagB/SusD family nutrient uptake outer membrane protein n=1 Tax=Tenacibaculum ovolyticum TaxID=104270 RepID=UPI00048F1000|nr:RagB/SusD family nutrient uptake outer membrane protein [Tenacibaculum ovolyticum]
MKKIIYLLLFIVNIACSLDLPVEDQITGLDAIDNVATANESLSGIYNAFPTERVIFSKLADDLYPNHTIDDNLSSYNLYKWNAKELVLLSNSLWAAYYDVNTKSNVLLSRIPFIETTNTDDSNQLKYIEAQALCLKAYAYFELIQLYCSNYNSNGLGIVLKDQIASAELPRSTQEASYLAVEKLLLKAINLFPEENSTNLRFSKNSTKALLTKLYFNWGAYQKAIDLSSQVITNLPLKNDDLDTVWLAPNNNNEALLTFDGESFYYSAIYDATKHNDEFYVKSSISYNTNDTRLANSFINEDFRLIDNSIIKVNFLKKYRNNTVEKTNTPIIMLRTAELYYIKAQSLAALNKEIEAKETINNLLIIRKANPIISSGTVFLSELLKDKQKEFVGEGNRYFDLKQQSLKLPKVNDTNNNHLFTIQPDDYRWLLPVPQSEISNNKAIQNQQNPNW